MSVFNIFASLLFLIVIASCGVEDPPPVPSPTPVQVQQDLGSSRELLSQGREAKVLYEELKGFRNKADFRRSGFAVGGPYSDWMKRAQALQNQAELDFFTTYGFGAGDIMILGMEYVSGGGGHSA